MTSSHHRRRKRAAAPFNVRQLCCPDGRTLTVAITHADRPRHNATLLIGDGSADVPVTNDRMGATDIFVADVGPLAATAHEDQALQIAIGRRCYRLPAPPSFDSALTEGPMRWAESWEVVTTDPADGTAVLHRATRRATVVATSIESTAHGIRVRVRHTGEPHAEYSTVIAQRQRDGERRAWAMSDNTAEIDLTTLPDIEPSTPDHWDVAVCHQERDVHIRADNTDIKHYGRAMNIPIFIFRNLDGNVLYAKPYFSSKGRLTIRTGAHTSSEPMA